MQAAGGDVIGLDWRVDLGKTWDALGAGVAVMGNLDPVTLLGPPDVMEREAARILREAAARPGHVFNLGHGVLPQTPVDHVVRLVDFVHEHGR
jgi:uroporphyrinogen decarboxylase